MKILPSKIYETLSIVPFTGKSMLPLFEPDDQLLVYFFKNTNESDVLEVGDIVLLKAAENWTAHRLMADQKTKGDRGLFPDVDDSPLWGRVDGLISKKKNYFWGPSGMKFKKIVAELSMTSGTFLKLKRWPILSLIWIIVKFDLLLHRAK